MLPFGIPFGIRRSHAVRKSCASNQKMISLLVPHIEVRNDLLTLHWQA